MEFNSRAAFDFVQASPLLTIKVLCQLMQLSEVETEDTLETPQVNIAEAAEEYRSLREVERRLNGEIFAPRTSASAVRNYPKSSYSSFTELYISEDGYLWWKEQDPASASSEFLNFMKFVLQLTQIDLLTIPCIMMWRADLLHMWTSYYQVRATQITKQVLSTSVFYLFAELHTLDRVMLNVNATAARQCSLKMQMSMQQQQGMVIQVSTVLKPHNADVEASQQQGNADVNAAAARHGNSSIYRVEASQCRC
ncbi:hypothetical protein K7X08_022931 [Anisodus acutangulus]|uniref:Uncharacterized protein n=1 Tax=Anisodus acutangulus TaxID=402998 RepID=A0A9Q1RGW1_9SOLA|nr:hypothetical protein K7X08_022931 [Anisodus acutangulus]